MAKRRSATLSIPKAVGIARTPVTIKGYDQEGKFVCRLVINGAGLLAYAGGKGGKEICNVTWERLVQILEDQH